ncbi:GCN5-related N-acetyltransferase 5, chloroplastic-like [Musa acuminata AAA Group]|uniref:GCN5-related N-acetyltransferase 5, chloroplastic-like n=1 Tax=Musa acuminata AAA Group TaxID=214697 RepID=UPI0031E3A231
MHLKTTIFSFLFLSLIIINNKNRKDSMACPPSSLSLSLDSTLQPCLFAPSSPSTTLAGTTTSLPPEKRQSSIFRSLLGRFSSSSATQPTASSRTDAPEQPGAVINDEAVQVLRDFRVIVELDRGGVLEIRPVEPGEMEATGTLLAETFSESRLVPVRYAHLIAFLVKQYLEERRALEPHVAVLIGFYKESDAEGPAQLACTAEISFDARGANVAPPTPQPPPDCPYICNMAVRKSLRRRRIGWHLLEACEELITRMKAKREVYLHCRVVDKGPFDMYRKAGYEVSKTDSYFIWLSLQRRKHLMWKKLPPPSDDDAVNKTSACDDHPI